MLNLRPYQQEACDAAEKELMNGSARTLVVMPTGTGKTICFIELLKRFRNRGRCMVIAHRNELIQQAVHRISEWTGEFPGIEKAELNTHEASWCRPPIVVASIQTLISGGERKRMHRFVPSDFSLVIVDEAHHAVSSSYRAVLEHFKHDNCRTVGVTATPNRHDEAALGQVFDSCAYEMGLWDAISAGWLVPIQQKAVQIEGLDFSTCRTTAGDLNGRDLEAVMNEEKNMLGVASAAMDFTENRPTIIFAPSVSNAERLCEILNRPNYEPGSAVFVSGKTDQIDRDERVGGFRNGRYRFLVNVGIAVEGFDAPATSCVLMARPTKSRALYEQMLGRGTRPLPGTVEWKDSDEDRTTAIANSDKPNMLVIDLAGNSGRHKLVNAFDVLGGEWSDDIAELAMRDATERGESVDVQKELALAAKKAKEERDRAEAAKRKHIHAKAIYSSARTVDPFDVLDVNPYRMKAYERNRDATESQKNCLIKFGLTPGDVENMPMNKARQLITSLIDRRKEGLCTYKQARQLQKRGLPTNVSFELAGRWMTLIANNQWRTPSLVIAEAESFR